MNQRIKLLAEQAGLDVIFHLKEMDLDGEIELWKFAELIVQECADIAFAKIAKNGEAVVVSNAILDSFGVER
jgi:hypothetical protein